VLPEQLLTFRRKGSVALDEVAADGVDGRVLDIELLVPAPEQPLSFFGIVLGNFERGGPSL
jgi:hypothetical protein